MVAPRLLSREADLAREKRCKGGREEPGAHDARSRRGT